MIALATMLLLAASTSVDLVDDLYQIPAGEWKYVEVDLRQRPAAISANFDLKNGSAQVRLALMTRADLDHLRGNLPYGVLAMTQAGQRGGFVFRVRERGDYVLVVDNRSAKSAAASVHLFISLDFADTRVPGITQLDPQRQVTVILLSFAFFFGVVTYSARKLLRGVRQTGLQQSDVQQSED
jgi:hypothetical protein